MFRDETFSIFLIKMVFNPIFRPVLTYIEIGYKALTNLRSASNERRDNIGYFLENTEVAVRDRVICERHAVVELLPACRNCGVWAVTHLGVDEIL